MGPLAHAHPFPSPVVCIASTNPDGLRLSPPFHWRDLALVELSLGCSYRIPYHDPPQIERERWSGAFRINFGQERCVIFEAADWQGSTLSDRRCNLLLIIGVDEHLLVYAIANAGCRKLRGGWARTHGRKEDAKEYRSERSLGGANERAFPASTSSLAPPSITCRLVKRQVESTANTLKVPPIY